MKSWFKFIILPILTMWLLEFLSSIALGYFFHTAPNSFLSLISYFIIYFLGGVSMYSYSPTSNKIIPPLIFAFIYIAFGVYLGIVNDGKVTIIMGEKVVSYFAITPIVVKAAGVFLAIIGAHENEKKSY